MPININHMGQVFGCNRERNFELTPEEKQAKDDEFYLKYDVDRATAVLRRMIDSAKQIRANPDNLLSRCELECMHVPMELFMREIDPDWIERGQRAFMCVVTLNVEFSCKLFQLLLLNSSNHQVASLDFGDRARKLSSRDYASEFLQVWKTTHKGRSSTRTVVNLYKRLESKSFGALSEPLRVVPVEEFHQFPGALRETDHGIRGWQLSVFEDLLVYFEQVKMEANADEAAFRERIKEKMKCASERTVEESVKLLCADRDFEQLKWYSSDDESAQEILELERNILIEKNEENSYDWPLELEFLIETLQSVNEE